MVYLTMYMLVVLVFMGFWSKRVPNENIDTVFVACIFWPFFIILMLCELIINALGWNFDIVITDKQSKFFGFRRASNPNARGWALRIYRAEFQLYSVKKAI